MRAPDWYDAWCEEAFAAFQAKQKAMTETFRLGDWERYDYDANRGMLIFSQAGRPQVAAEIQVLGTTAADEWVWGWAHPQWPLQSIAAAMQVRDFGTANGIEELTTDLLKSDDLDGLGWMLCAIAARILDAPGAYRVPSEAGGLFLLIRSLKSVS
jgi:hypothetical protein